MVNQTAALAAYIEPAAFISIVIAFEDVINMKFGFVICLTCRQTRAEKLKPMSKQLTVIRDITIQLMRRYPVSPATLDDFYHERHFAFAFSQR